MSSARYGGAWQDKDEKTQHASLYAVNASLNWQPVELLQNWRDMVASSGSSEKTSSGVLNGLNSLDTGEKTN